MKHLFVPFMMITIAHSVAFPRTFYVGGSDGIATIQAAVDQAGAGDTVLVRNGTYHERLSITSSGTESSYLVIMAAPGQEPIIDGQYTLPGTNKWAGLIEIRANYLEFNGFTVKNSSGRGIKMLTGSSHIHILNNDVNYNWNAGINSIEAEYLLVKNNKVWQNARHNAGENRNMTTGWPGCLMLEDSRHCRIVGNEVYQNHGEGIIYLRSTDGVIEDNICWDNLAVNLYLDNAARCLVQRNIVYSTDDQEFWRWAPDWPTHGIFIANEIYVGWPSHDQGKDLVIINNIVFHTRFGIAFWTESGVENSALVRVLIANNSFYDIFDIGLQLGAPSAGTVHEARVYNNIIHSRKDMIRCATWTGIDFKNNCWSKTPLSQASSSADVIGDPEISAQGSTAGGALTAEYFKLTQTSPCIGKALTVTEVSKDFFGTNRDNKPDIGIHEYQGTTYAGPYMPHTFTTPGVFQNTFLLNGRFKAGAIMRTWNTGASNVVIRKSAGLSPNAAVTSIR